MRTFFALLLIVVVFSCEQDKVIEETNILTDFDGNTYETVVIGNQEWMVENLKVTHYADGTPIPLVEDEGIWDNLGSTDKAYCFYDNSSSNGDIYGALYTWAAAMNGQDGSDNNPSGVQGACPTGWHLPSDAEWKELEMYLGMSQEDADDTGWRGTDEGIKLKAESGWIQDGNGTNESGFTALPGGYRSGGGAFAFDGVAGIWWTSKVINSDSAWYRSIYDNRNNIARNVWIKNYGYSVRCLKD
ncbi:FISUMP domain-containing protein [Bacteroidota bacterium]